MGSDGRVVFERCGLDVPPNAARFYSNGVTKILNHSRNPIGQVNFSFDIHSENIDEAMEMFGESMEKATRDAVERAKEEMTKPAILSPTGEPVRRNGGRKHQKG